MHDTPLKELVGRTVLIIGGADLIRSRMAAHLRKVGARPVSLCTPDAHRRHAHRDLFGVDPADPDVIVGNIQNAGVAKKMVAESDYVIHAVALADVAPWSRKPMAAIQANIIGTQVILDAVASSERIRRFVFVSSADVYGDGNPEGWARPSDEYRDMRQLLQAVYGRVSPQFHENTELRPTSVHANSQAWGETQTALTLGAAHTSYAILRYFSVYGEPQVIEQRSQSSVVAWFANRAALALPLYLNGDGRQIRDLIHVEDVAAATVRALVAPQAHNETINIGTGIATSIRTVAELVAERYPNTRIMETTTPPRDPLGGYAAAHRMQTVLGWRPTITVEEGVARYTNWLRGNPMAIPAWLRAESNAATV